MKIRQVTSSDTVNRKGTSQWTLTTLIHAGPYTVKDRPFASMRSMAPLKRTMSETAISVEDEPLQWMADALHATNVTLRNVA